MRKYGDGRFRYSIAPLDDRDEVGTIFDEADLRGTGERASASPFTTFGAFQIRDVVRISSRCEHSAIAGLTGVIEGGDADDEGSMLVWISQLKEVWVVRADDLQLTGERMPPSGPRQARSVKVSETGEVLGKDEYVVLDDVRDL